MFKCKNHCKKMQFWGVGMIWLWLGFFLKKNHIFIFSEYTKFKMIKYSDKVQSDLLYAYIHI